jgi:hypothetical protein
MARSFILIALLTGIGTSLPVHAATLKFLTEDVVCAQVYPCDEKGELMPEFNHPSDPCFSFYLGQCVSEPVEHISCAPKEQEIQKLRKDLRRLRRKLNDNRRRSDH